MISNFLRRDFRFGTEKSINYISAFILFVLIPMISYILFSRDFEDIFKNFLLPKLETSGNVFRQNIFFILTQVFILISYCKYVYDDLFTFNKIMIIRYKNRIVFCISKILFICAYNFILVSIMIFINYLTCKNISININNIFIFIKIIISYTIGAISLSIFNLLLAMIFKESIGFLLTVLSVVLNLIFKTHIFPGGGYITSLYNGYVYIYSLIYSAIIIIILGIFLTNIYKRIDLM